MADGPLATHAHCPRCNSFEPLVWTQVKIAQPHTNGTLVEFVGLKMECRTCEFEITKVGTVRTIAVG